MSCRLDRFKAYWVKFNTNYITKLRVNVSPSGSCIILFHFTKAIECKQGYRFTSVRVTEKLSSVATPLCLHFSTLRSERLQYTHLLSGFADEMCWRRTSAISQTPYENADWQVESHRVDSHPNLRVETQSRLRRPKPGTHDDRLTSLIFNPYSQCLQGFHDTPAMVSVVLLFDSKSPIYFKSIRINVVRSAYNSVTLSESFFF